MREIVYRHASGEVRLNEGKPVREGKCELADRVRARLGDVITGDLDRIKIAHLMLSKILLNIPHDLETKLSRENTGVLPLVLF